MYMNSTLIQKCEIFCMYLENEIQPIIKEIKLKE